MNSTALILPKETIVRVRPRRALRIEPRSLFVSKDAHDLLSGVTSISAGFPDSSAHALIDTYIGGEFLKVSLSGRNSIKGPEFERLYDVDEVWVVCFRKVSMSQWRLMGRFSQFNTFVGLSMHRREDLAGRTKGTKNYELKAEAFIERWNHCFQNAEPHRGSHWTDYLSGSIRDVDNEF